MLVVILAGCLVGMYFYFTNKIAIIESQKGHEPKSVHGDQTIDIGGHLSYTIIILWVVVLVLIVKF